MSKVSGIEKLFNIQQVLNVPKNQKNKFGGYTYRSCEDILLAAKKPLFDNRMVLTLSDRMVDIGGRVYVESTATIDDLDSDFTKSVTALARESENKKGMDDSQITGSTSSYSRKYSLNGLFCIDDNKDADATNDHGKKESIKPSKNKEQKKEMTTEQKVNYLIDYFNRLGINQELIESYAGMSITDFTEEQVEFLKPVLENLKSKKMTTQEFIDLANKG